MAQTNFRLIEFKEKDELVGVIELDKTAGKIHGVGNRRYVITHAQCAHLYAKHIEYTPLKDINSPLEA